MASRDEGLLSLGLQSEVSLSTAESARDRVTALYEQHRNQIYRFLVAQGLAPAVAQEISQDVFVDLYKAIASGAKISAELGWLYTVAGRAAVDYWRREHRPIWVELDSDSSGADEIPSAAASPETSTLEKQKLQRVANGIRRLPKEQRLSIHLRMQGLRYREIGKILGVSTSTAAEWISLAVERLRREAHD